MHLSAVPELQLEVSKVVVFLYSYDCLQPTRLGLRAHSYTLTANIFLSFRWLFLNPRSSQWVSRRWDDRTGPQYKYSIREWLENLLFSFKRSYSKCFLKLRLRREGFTEVFGRRRMVNAKNSLVIDLREGMKGRSEVGKGFELSLFRFK